HVRKVPDQERIHANKTSLICTRCWHLISDQSRPPQPNTTHI
uniref:Uncharacterized protein n=1 Tax=Aegilops tauschii subsp. strangulata TaxID=200361 RepID=A0A453I401_AEGTS